MKKHRKFSAVKAINLTGGSILFLCLARNCAETVTLLFDYMKSLAEVGLRCHAIIGENGSSDGTRALIESQIGSSDAILLDTSFMEMAEGRLVRMAIGRQALLEAAWRSGNDDDYICVVDLDNAMYVLPSPTSVEDAISSLRADPSLFAIGASSFPVYYDLLSLRAEGYESLAGLNKEISDAKKNPLSYYQFHKRRIYPTQRMMTCTTPTVCKSSFNGFCMYNASDYFKGTYRATNESDVCEHVNLNLSIGRFTGRKMLISPKLLIRAPADHTPVGFFRFWFDRVVERL